LVLLAMGEPGGFRKRNLQEPPCKIDSRIYGPAVDLSM
jgi:hypothetical protein